MKISFEKIDQYNDPYQLFVDSIKSDETKRRYKKNLYRFLKLIPNKIYQDTIDISPAGREIETLSSCFVKLAQKEPKLAQNIISAFIKEDKKLVESGQLNPNTLPNHVKPIRALLDANSIPMHWKSLHKLYPRPKNTQDRAYTREELQRMVEASPHITDKLIIQLFSSGGFRVEAWDYFTWQDVVFFKNQDGTFKGAALQVYRGDPESYFTFITPEACRTLENYREVWKSEIGRYPLPKEPLIRTVKFPVIRRLNSSGVKKRVLKIVKKIGLRPPLPPNKKRHEIPLDHGFRKYFNTMMRRAKVNYLDKEDMMGHSVGLERHYERYQEEDFERFPEYQKAIPFLTIDPTERQRLKIHQLEDEKTLFAKKEKEIENLKTNIEQMVEEKVNEYNQKLMKELDNMYEEKRIAFMKKQQKKDTEFLKNLYSTK